MSLFVFQPSEVSKLLIWGKLTLCRKSCR